MSFEPKLKGSERVSHATIWRKSTLGRRKGKSKSLQEEGFWFSENKEGWKESARRYSHAGRAWVRSCRQLTVKNFLFA